MVHHKSRQSLQIPTGVIVTITPPVCDIAAGCLLKVSFNYDRQLKDNINIFKYLIKNDLYNTKYQ